MKYWKFLNKRAWFFGYFFQDNGPERISSCIWKCKEEGFKDRTLEHDILFS